MTRVKICGLTSVQDALASVEAGADAIGLNFARRSPRRVELDVARAIVEALPPHVLSVGVFVDASEAEIREVIARTGVRCVQLHGEESPELVALFQPHAYKALRVRGHGAIEQAARYPGEYILLDAYVPGVEGGTGATFDWAIAAKLTRLRKVTLAGGLTPDNVANAVREVQPFCVDVASGVESSPRQKDVAKVRAFVEAAKHA